MRIWGLGCGYKGFRARLGFRDIGYVDIGFRIRDLGFRG